MTEAKKKIQRVFQGVVVSDKMAKTIVVKVDSMKWHKKYKTQYRVSRNSKCMTRTVRQKRAMWLSLSGRAPFPKKKGGGSRKL